MTLAQETPYVLGLRSSSVRNSINQRRTPEICLKELECLIAQGGRLFWLVVVDFSFFCLLGLRQVKAFKCFCCFGFFLTESIVYLVSENTTAHKHGPQRKCFLQQGWDCSSKWGSSFQDHSPGSTG